MVVNDPNRLVPHSHLPFSDFGSTGINSAIFSSISTVSFESDIFRFDFHTNHHQFTKLIFILRPTRPHNKLIEFQKSTSSIRCNPTKSTKYGDASSAQRRTCSFTEIRLLLLQYFAIFSRAHFQLELLADCLSLALGTGIVSALHYKLPVRLHGLDVLAKWAHLLNFECKCVYVGVNERSNERKWNRYIRNCLGKKDCCWMEENTKTAHTHTHTRSRCTTHDANKNGKVQNANNV